MRASCPVRAGSDTHPRTAAVPNDPHGHAPPPHALLSAAFGVLAALVGTAAGHLTAALLDPASSPVLAVGSAVIDRTPTPMKEWAIRTFGDDDKTVLVGSVLAGVLVLAAVAGLLARRGWSSAPRCCSR